MKPVPARQMPVDELAVVIALIWGRLNARQFDAAYTLAQGCLLVWPTDLKLQILAAYATSETGRTLDAATLKTLRKHRGHEWADLILRRALPTESTERSAA